MQAIKQQFNVPPKEFTPIPFWFWNDALDRNEIIGQLRDFHNKGIDGVVIHPRIGLPRSIPYLSDVFMEHVKAAVEEADRLGMHVILYDEGMYPSGAANGMVVRNNPSYASRGLKLKEYSCSGTLSLDLSDVLQNDDSVVSVQAVCKAGDSCIDYERTIVLKTTNHRVQFSPPDQREWVVVVLIDTLSNGHIRGIHNGQDDGEEDAPRSADLLNPEAIRSFITLTHEKYYKWLKPFFGKSIIAMFTDEPDLLGRGHLRGLKPWTHGFLQDLLDEGNKESDLPLLWFDPQGSQSASFRNQYNRTVRKRMSQVYYKQLYDWCEEHGIALTGHPADSDDIGLLEYFHIPGQDVVWRFIAPGEGTSLVGQHSTLGKCSSDAARHRGRRRNLNECFGVCSKLKGWDFSGDELKWYLDWLLIRGVNLIVPHAFYYSIRDERRDERPPDVGKHNIWWDEYRRFTLYIKRMSWLMTDSHNTAQVAVLCRGERLSWRMVKPLYEQQIEFNYLEEELLQKNCSLQSGCIHINDYHYNVVLVEEGRLYAPQTWALLKEFLSSGGTVIELANEGEMAHAIGQQQPTSAEQIPEIISNVLRDDLPLLTPGNSDIRISHLIKDNVHFYAVVNEGETGYAGKLTTSIQGHTEIWNPWTGEMEEAAMQVNGGQSEIVLHVNRRECVWIVIDDQQPVQEKAARELSLQSTFDLSQEWEISGTRNVNHSESLSSWTEWDDMDHFSGTVYYEKIFILDAREYDRVRLDLGEVHEMAKVWINDQEAGVCMWAPYQVDLEDYVREGENHLRIAVTNSLANQYDGQVLPSGLTGPVSLRCYK